jgi:integrase/recombinase XerD
MSILTKTYVKPEILSVSCQAKILSSDEIAQLFSTGLKTARDRALFGICLYMETRIAEACFLQTKDVYTIDGSIRPRVTIRKRTTEGKIGK